MADLRETSIERVQGDSYCTVYTGEKKFVNKLKKMAEEYPEDVNIISEDCLGIVAHVPYDWFKFISPKRKHNLTDEQRQAASERMRRAREIGLEKD